MNRASRNTACLLLWSVAAASACLGMAHPAFSHDKPTLAKALDCDESITANFKPDAYTTVRLVKQYKKGDILPYDSPFLAGLGVSVLSADADLCLVKLLVGPGNPGSEGAPSTSAGIGIEIWLPAKDAWTGRVHAVGGGGWAGTEETDLNKISSGTVASDLTPAPMIAAREGSVASSTDTGHRGSAFDGSFAMLPDGSMNTKLWEDFSSRAIHEQALKTKALARAYYGAKVKYSYWSGGSTGGRQALKLAQRYPGDFDGIIAAFPAINWTRFITAELYPQIVIQRDLGGRYMSADQLNLVSNAAIAACDTVGGKHLGFIIDADACRYDPVKDPGVLCADSGGKNDTPACVSRAQALAINKIWYGMTVDGSVPDPAIDNGSGPLAGVRCWYGWSRGTNLGRIAGEAAFSIATDMAALQLQNPKLGGNTFRNPTGNGEEGWKSLSYAQLAQMFDIGVAMQDKFAFINTDDPDLSAFKARGGKLIQYHGTNDELIPHMGSVNYYQRVINKMGGLAQVQPFYRFYVIPAMAHGPMNGSANPAANPPTTGLMNGQMFAALMAWVEKSVAPDNVVLRSNPGGSREKSLPMCAYPQKITYQSGDPYQASSYACR